MILIKKKTVPFKDKSIFVHRSIKSVISLFSFYKSIYNPDDMISFIESKLGALELVQTPRQNIKTIQKLYVSRLICSFFKQLNIQQKVLSHLVIIRQVITYFLQNDCSGNCNIFDAKLFKREVK